MDIPHQIEKLQNITMENTEIVSVSYEDSGTFHQIPDTPHFYRVVLRSTPGAGSLIYTELWLPEDWNGVFVGLGNGGMAGDVWHELIAGYVRRGYAAAQTDMGTSGGRNRGIGNPDVWKDFGWRATHNMAEVCKTILCCHYGKKADYAYFVGGSTGGQQALSLAQRFPADFDGIIAGVPANNRIFLHTYFLWNHNHLRTPDGTTRFTEAEVLAISASAAEFFQSIGDGTPGDRFVSFPYNGADTVERFLDFLHHTHPDLTAAQLDALRAIYHGPVNPATGKQIYNGMPIGSERYGCGIMECQQEESPHFYPFIWAFGADYDGYSFDFDKDLDKLSDLLSEDLNANCPDLTAFKNRSGKLIAYSGSADPCVPFPDAMGYFERVMDTMGGYEETASFFRYFLSPGKDHGTEGLGSNVFLDDSGVSTDLLDALRTWREKGEAPAFLVAARTEGDQVKFARKIYPYASKENPQREFPPVCDADYLKK